MQLVERHIITDQHKLYNEIDALSFASKNLYNLANYHIRQHYFATNEVLSYGKLDKLLQSGIDYKALPAKVSQQVLIQLTNNWKGYLNASKEYETNPDKFEGKPRCPRYKHKTDGRNLLIYTIQATSKKLLRQNIIHLSKTNIKLLTNKKNINQMRIVPSPLGHYVIEIVYQVSIKQLSLSIDKIAGIDIGIDNLGAVTSNQAGFIPLLINGRPLKSINSYFNKQRTLLQSYVGSKGTSKRINQLTHKRNCKIDNYLHNASRYVIDMLVKYGIGRLVIGKNPQWKQEINLGKVNNQNFVAIPHARFIKQLQYKAALVGIEVITIEESYTSKCSFLDNEPIAKQQQYVGRRVKRGLFRSTSGVVINADINGSANIIRKAFPGAFADGIQAVVVQPLRVTPYKLNNVGIHSCPLS